MTTRRRVLGLLGACLVLTTWTVTVAAQTPTRGGVLRMAEREAAGLDPHLTIDFLTQSTVSLVYSLLVRFPSGPEQKSSTDFSILPDLAEKWTVSKDGTVYTFHLRHGVRFHSKAPVNGREVEAADVKFSLERFMAKSALRDRLEPVQAIDVVDKSTVRITLKEPYAPFLNHLANPSYCAILPREVEAKFKDYNHPDAVIGSGPFVLKTYERGVRLVFERNPNYFMKGLPYLDGFVFEVTPDSAARVSMLRAGKIELPHIWGWLSPEEAKSVQKTNPEIVSTRFEVINQGRIFMRTDQPPFNDVRVRRAVSLAIDRKTWNETLIFGEGCVDSGPVPCGMDWKLDAARIDPAKTKYLVGYDPAEAKRLLAEAGFPRGFTTPLYHFPGFPPPWRSYYDLAADMLGRIGISVELKPEELGKWSTTTNLGKFEKMAMGPYGAGVTEVDDFLTTMFLPGAAWNRSHVNDAELTRMLLAQRREIDPKKRREIIHEIQRYLADKAYYVYVPVPPRYVSHPPYVKGFKHHDGYDLGRRLTFTWIEK